MMDNVMLMLILEVMDCRVFHRSFRIDKKVLNYDIRKGGNVVKS